MQEYAYGGIVFNNEGKILMRSPSGHWGGYVWTFAKGGTEENDKSPEEVAIREVLEETGYEMKREQADNPALSLSGS